MGPEGPCDGRRSRLTSRDSDSSGRGAAPKTATVLPQFPLFPTPLRHERRGRCWARHEDRPPRFVGLSPHRDRASTLAESGGDKGDKGPLGEAGCPWRVERRSGEFKDVLLLGGDKTDETPACDSPLGVSSVLSVAQRRPYPVLGPHRSSLVADPCSTGRGCEWPSSPALCRSGPTARGHPSFRPPVGYPAGRCTFSPPF
jgi:hypothetical protein